MKKLTLFSLIICLCCMPSCRISIETPEVTQETTVAELEFSTYGYGWSWLYQVNEHIQLENGVFEVPTTDDQGIPIVGIGRDSVENLEQIEEIVIGDHIQWISDYGICNMPNLKRVCIGANVNELREGVFHNCPQLNEVIISSENQYFISVNNCILSKDGKQLLRVWNSSFEIPATVEVITYCSFADCSFLEKMVIPEGITTIEMAAFAHCLNMREVYLPNTMKTVKALAFTNTSQDLTICIPPNLDVSSFDEGWDMLHWEKSLKVVVGDPSKES